MRCKKCNNELPSICEVCGTPFISSSDCPDPVGVGVRIASGNAGKSERSIKVHGSVGSPVEIVSGDSGLNKDCLEIETSVQGNTHPSVPYMLGAPIQEIVIEKGDVGLDKATYNITQNYTQFVDLKMLSEIILGPKDDWETESIFLVLCDQLIESWPEPGISGNLTFRTHVLPPGLGYLRSLTPVMDDGKRLFMIGAQLGIFVYDASNHVVIAQYRFPDREKVRFGVNSIAIHEGVLYGSHSELGLLKWNLGIESVCERVLPDVFKPGLKIRGVCIDGNRDLIVSCDRSLFRLQVARHPLVSMEYTYSTCAGSIQGFACADNRLFAVTECGNLYCWDRNRSGEGFLLRKLGFNAYSLMYCKALGKPALIIGGGYQVNLLSLEETCFVDRLFPSTLHTILGARFAPDFITAIADHGRNLILWKTDQAGWPSTQVYRIKESFGHTIQDLVVLLRPKHIP